MVENRARQVMSPTLTLKEVPGQVHFRHIPEAVIALAHKSARLDADQRI